jgi:hypothetical protein
MCCDHPPESVVEDTHTADLICTACAHVVQPDCLRRPWSASAPKMAPTDTTPTPRPSGSNPACMRAHTLLLRETVLDVCSLLHLEETTCLVDTVCHILQQQLGVCSSNADEEGADSAISHGRVRGGRGARPELADDKFRVKLAYAICEALNRQGTPRPPQAVAALCDVPPGSLLRLEKEFNLRPTYCQPEQYVDTVCAMLELPYLVSGIASMLCKHLQDALYGAKPESLVIASVLAAVEKVREKGEEGGADFAPHVTLPNLCKLFDVKSKSVLQMKEYMPGLTLEVCWVNGKKYRYWVH